MSEGCHCHRQAIQRNQVSKGFLAGSKPRTFSLRCPVSEVDRRAAAYLVQLTIVPVGEQPTPA